MYWFSWMKNVTTSAPQAPPCSPPPELGEGLGEGAEVPNAAIAAPSSRCRSKVLFPAPGGPNTTTAGSGTAATSAAKSS